MNKDTLKKLAETKSDGDGNCPIHSSKGILRPHPFEEAPKSCPTCAGEYHEPCPYREEAKKRVWIELYGKQSLDANGYRERLYAERARSLRLEVELDQANGAIRGASAIIKSRDEELAALQQRLASCKAFHASLCRRFGYGHDDTDWMRDFVSLEEHIASSLTHYGERVRKEAAEILRGEATKLKVMGAPESVTDMVLASAITVSLMSLPPLNEEGVK